MPDLSLAYKFSESFLIIDFKGKLLLTSQRTPCVLSIPQLFIVQTSWKVVIYDYSRFDINAITYSEGCL